MAQQAKEISRQFEVGSHAINHVDLRPLPTDSAWNDIQGTSPYVRGQISALGGLAGKLGRQCPSK
jgi:hypothetical protein